MIRSIRGALGQLADTALGHHVKDALPDALRRALRVHPPFLKRPLQAVGSFSDLFPWFSSAKLETKVDLMNLPSLMFPDLPINDTVHLVLFDGGGAMLTSHEVELPRFGTQVVNLGQLAPPDVQEGTFLIFHEPDQGLDQLVALGGYLVDRQYIAIRRPGATLWSHVHGNYAAIFRRADGSIQSQVSRQTGVRRFAPQIRFDDCHAYTIIYTNAADYPVHLELDIEGADHAVLETLSLRIAPRGLLRIDRDNPEFRETHVVARSNIPFLRPYFMKHYESHFDFLHS